MREISVREIDFHYRKFHEDEKIKADFPGSWHNISFSIIYINMETDVNTPLPHNRFRNSEHWTAFLCSDSSLHHLHDILLHCYIDCWGERLSVFYLGIENWQPVKIILLISLWYKHDWNIFFVNLYAIMSVLMIQKKRYLVMIMIIMTAFEQEKI